MYNVAKTNVRCNKEHYAILQKSLQLRNMSIKSSENLARGSRRCFRQMALNSVTSFAHDSGNDDNKFWVKNVRPSVFSAVLLNKVP